VTFTPPTIRNLEEATQLARDFPAVLTVGPRPHEVNFGHPNHVIVPVSDVIDPGHWDAPTTAHVQQIIDFGLVNDGAMLVHCHMGISRSSAAAITVLVARGVDAESAVRTLAHLHPKDRQFVPNDLIIAGAAELLGVPELPEVAEAYAKYGWVTSG
jgi:predicted protein tyrosine phosphatase